MNSPKKPPTKLRKQALLKLAKMDPKQRVRLARIELMRRGLNPSAPPKKG